MSETTQQYSKHLEHDTAYIYAYDPHNPKSDRDHIQSMWQNLNNYTQFRGSREPFFAPHSRTNAHREDSPAEAANQTPPHRRILQQKTPPVDTNRNQDICSVPNEGRFVESIMRLSANPSRRSTSDPDTFLDDLIQWTLNIICIRILTPLPAEVCPELLKKHNVPFPTTKWLGENDLEKFETWIYDLVLWLLSSRWKGPAYNEQQVSTLTQMLEGEPKLIMIHDNKEGYERGYEVSFLEHLTKLMHMYIKRSAAVPSTKLFKTLSYDSLKGIKSFYTQLLHVLERMITCPYQATFNKHFINALPSHFKEELVMHDKISVNFSLREELWQVVL